MEIDNKEQFNGYQKAYESTSLKSIFYRIVAFIIFIGALIGNLYFGIKIDENIVISIIATSLFFTSITSSYRFERLAEDYRYKEISKNELNKIMEDYKKDKISEEIVDNVKHYQHTFNELSKQLKTNPVPISFKEAENGIIGKFFSLFEKKYETNSQYKKVDEGKKDEPSK